MFSTERSDFGSTIAGYLFSAIALIFAGLQFFNQQFDIFDVSAKTPMEIMGVILIAASAVALWKAYIIDGITYMVIGLAAFALSYAAATPMFFIVLAIAALAVAFMSFRSGGYFSLGLNSVLAIAFILAAFTTKITFLGDNPVVTGIFFLIAGLIAGYLCISDWMLFQDIMSDYADEMFDEDGCCCDDECDCDDEECHCHDEGHECGDDCECHCHDEKE